jgi:hypothetical protein
MNWFYAFWHHYTGYHFCPSAGRKILNLLGSWHLHHDILKFFFKKMTWTCVAEPEPHHFDGAGAVTPCGSGSSSDSSGSKLNVNHRWIIKNVINCNSFLFLPIPILIIQKIKGMISPILREHFYVFKSLVFIRLFRLKGLCTVGPLYYNFPAELLFIPWRASLGSPRKKNPPDKSRIPDLYPLRKLI